MSLFLNSNELTALRDLPFIQRITYLMGIKPYIDSNTGIVGIRHKISYQSLREVLYVAPIAGTKTEQISLQQVRRAVKSLERAGLIENISTESNLILKCNLAFLSQYTQNQADRDLMRQADSHSLGFESVKSRDFRNFKEQADRVLEPQADTHHYNNIYIFLYTAFEKFWALYPLKKSKAKAFEIFQKLNPGEALIAKIMQSLQLQISHNEQQLSQGKWVPNWKYPANWLADACWEDEIPKEDIYAKRNTASTKEPYDFFWESCKGGADFYEQNRANVIKFRGK